MQLRSQTMNTVDLAASSAATYIYWRSHTSIVLCYKYEYAVYIYYVCISVKGALIRNPNQHFNYTRIIRSMTLQKTLCKCMRIWQWVVSNRGGSSEVTYGCDRVWHVLFSGLISMLVLDILQIPGACIAVIGPLWLRAWWYEKKMEEEAEVVDAEENISRRMKRLGKRKHWRWRPGDEKRLREGQKKFQRKMRDGRWREEKKKKMEGGVKILR
jgi:hypothetical protein